MGRKIRHSDKDVKFWAEIYTGLGITLEEIEKRYGVSHSTTFRCFVHRLPYIDDTLYMATMKLMNEHRHHYRMANNE